MDASPTTPATPSAVASQSADPAAKAKGKGGSRMPEATCGVVKYLLDKNEKSCRQIAQEVKTCPRTIERMKLSYSLFSQPYPPPGPRGRPRALTTHQEEWLLEYLNSHPSANVDDMAKALKEQFDLKISGSTVFNCLKRRKWSRKTMRESVIDHRKPRTKQNASAVPVHSNMTGPQLAIGADDAQALFEHNNDHPPWTWDPHS